VTATGPKRGEAPTQEGDGRTRHEERTLYSDLGHLARRAGEATRDAERLCVATVRSRPVAGVAAATGIGFVLGGGVRRFQRGWITLLLGAGVRLAASRVGDRILEYADELWYADDREDPR